MQTDTEADEAIALDGKMLGSHVLKVAEARPREDRTPHYD
jgi:hypothetical protein